MPCPRLLSGRLSSVGSYYLITSVTRNRRVIFDHDESAHVVADELHRVQADGYVHSIAWVVMPDHVHWLFRLEQGLLGRCVQMMKSRAARRVNALRREEGAVWQAGYFEHCLRTEREAKKQATYVVADPLRRGLVARIEDYPHWWCRWISSSADL